MRVADDYTIVWTTTEVADVWRIENADSTAQEENDGFDIGGFNVFLIQPTEDLKFDFKVAITDFDGDVEVSNTFSVGVDGTGEFDNDEVAGVAIA